VIQKVHNYINVSLLLIVSALGLATLSPAVAQADCGGNILTLKPWHHGLTDGECNVTAPVGRDAQRKFVTRIILTIVEDLLQVAAYITVAFIIMGGFTYMTSGGSPDKAAKGLKTIINAAIGLIIAMASVAIVNFIGGNLGL
jgi:hypothetical protein